MTCNLTSIGTISFGGVIGVGHKARTIPRVVIGPGDFLEDNLSCKVSSFNQIFWDHDVELFVEVTTVGSAATMEENYAENYIGIAERADGVPRTLTIGNYNYGLCIAKTVEPQDPGLFVHRAGFITVKFTGAEKPVRI